jgi:hypothetical protein
MFTEMQPNAADPETPLCLSRQGTVAYACRAVVNRFDQTERTSRLGAGKPVAFEPRSRPVHSNNRSEVAIPEDQTR